MVWHGILFNVKNVPWFKEGWKNWSSQQKQTTALARNPGAHRQLAVPTLLKPWGQLLLAQAAQEVQGVYLLSLWEISQRPGAGVWEHRRCLTASARPSLDLLKESLFGTVLKAKNMQVKYSSVRSVTVMQFVILWCPHTTDYSWFWIKPSGWDLKCNTER